MWEIVSLLCFIGFALAGIAFWLKPDQRKKQAPLGVARDSATPNNKTKE